MSIKRHANSASAVVRLGSAKSWAQLRPFPTDIGFARSTVIPHAFFHREIVKRPEEFHAASHEPLVPRWSIQDDDYDDLDEAEVRQLFCLPSREQVTAAELSSIADSSRVGSRNSATRRPFHPTALGTGLGINVVSGRKLFPSSRHAAPKFEMSRLTGTLATLAGRIRDLVPSQCPVAEFAEVADERPSAAIEQAAS